ncbi:EAL domain-containing response regulator [Corallincola spongiicola]|uniref:EAL domain-containing protein n=1 Tax=Corallincola spongiicola TaxID=2520508 RepID=A0ABY1WNS2_9GAMM|nr:EAL domain-containing response regulator [Corallincola spongiicola]TAA45206.1 EAL domain-containing protein [Corallincola spongiicola]
MTVEERDKIRELRILLVEDQPVPRQLLLQLLERLGVEQSWQAEDGKQALQLLSEGILFDIILCDLQMPNMDGLEFIRHLGQRSFHGGLILVSAESDMLLHSAEAMATEYGLKVFGTLAKPVQPSQLVSMLAHQSSAESLTDNELPIALHEVMEGLEQGEFNAVFQPKVRFDNRQWIGVESLVRWYHPSRGVITPGFFLPLLERAGEIELLSEVMLSASLAQSRQFIKQGQEVTVAVNLPPNSMTDTKFCDRFMRLLKRYQVPPELCMIELTECELTADLGPMIETLARLRMNGVQLAIDDFGTGYSSLEKLGQIPFTELKIDQSFVRDAARKPKLRAIVEASLDVAKKLGLSTVAEGVEDAAGWQLLRELGCDYCQGYYAAEPMMSADLDAWQQQWAV